MYLMRLGLIYMTHYLWTVKQKEKHKAEKKNNKKMYIKNKKA